MPFVVEQVVETNNQNVEPTETIGKDPIFTLIVILALLLYFFRGIVFSLLKFGFIAFLTILFVSTSFKFLS